MLDTIKGVLPAWPEWALDVLIVMSVLLIATIIFSSLYSGDDDDDKALSKSTDAHARGELHKQFDKFRRKYISVYLVIMLADWMYVPRWQPQARYSRVETNSGI